MEPDAYLTIELEPYEAFAETLKPVFLPWSGRTVTVRVAPGTVDGTVLRLAGLGPTGVDGAPLDAYVQVRVKAAPAQFGPPPATGPSGEQFGPLGAPGLSSQPGQPAPYPGPYPQPVPAAPGPARRRIVLIGAAVAVVALLVCCGLPVAYFATRDDGNAPAASVNGTASATPGAPSPSATQITPDEYQALLAEADRTLAAGFKTLSGARNPKSVGTVASNLAATAENQSLALDAVVPPSGVTAPHSILVRSLSGLAAALRETSSAAALGSVCLGPAAVSRVSRESAADGLRSAASALATADPSRSYQVGSFVPKETRDGNRRLSNGSYVKRTQGGLGQLKIENGGTDAVISIVRGKTAVTRVYVRSKSNFTVRGVRDGTYQVFMTSGKDWDNRLKGFSRDCEFERFDDSFKFSTTSRTYTGWTITLTPVVGGNASTSDVDPDAFPAD